MAKTVLFLDNDFLVSAFGEAQGDANRLTRILDGLFEKYDIKITNTVFSEAITNNIDPATGERYLKDSTVENWLSSKSINQTPTSIVVGSVTNAGEKSIIEAIKADPALYDGANNAPRTGTFEIASNDGFFSTVESGAFSQAQTTSYQAVEQGVRDGRIHFDDFKSLATTGSPSSNWAEPNALAKDIVETNTGKPVTVDVDGNITIDIDAATGKKLLVQAGIAGDLIGLLFIARDAQAAHDVGDDVLASEIITGGIANLAGGAVGGIGAAAMIAPLVTPLLAGGPVGAVVAAILVGLVGILGSVAGGAAAEETVRKLFDIGKELNLFGDAPSTGSGSGVSGDVGDVPRQAQLDS